MSVKEVEGFYPLSPMQQGMLYHTLYAPESGAYMQQVSCTLKGELNVAAFEQAWQQVIDRHPVLRSAFLWEKLKGPVQLVQRQVKLPLEQQDWQHFSAARQATELEALLTADRARGFELAHAPLLRLFLLRLGTHAYQFIWSHHHILFDGWSVPLLLQEVFAFYEAGCRGERLKLDQPRPFRDYIAWLKQQDISRAETYWRRALAGFTTPTRLSIDHTGEIGFAEEQVRLSAEVSEQVQRFAREQQVTVNTVVQAAWALLLSRYSGEEEVLFGATVSGRPAELAGVEQMVGLFINSLPVRVRVNGEAQVGTWLRELQAQVMELRQYEYSPLVEVQGWSDVKRGQNLFDTLVVFDNFPVGESLEKKEGSLEIRDVEVSGNNHLRLTLTAVPSAEFWFLLNYDKAYFETTSIRRMLGHLATVLESMCANPRVWEVRLLSAAEEAHVLRQGNEKRVEYEVGSSLAELFERQVEQRPAATALLWEERQVSYEELNRRANQLGHYLRRLGVGPESLVALVMERSVEMVAAVLGVLKAGGAYLPVDPAYPTERVRFMLEDAGATVVLTTTAERAEYESGRARVVRLADAWQDITTQPETNPASVTTPDNLAYVIYTSGSTGKPKGVYVSNRNLVHSTTARFRYYEHPVGTFLLLSSFAFDSSVAGIFWTLAQGGALLLPSQGIERDPSELRALIQRHQVTDMLCLPSLYALLLDQAQPGQLSSLRTVIVAGESCPVELIATHYDLLNQAVLFNEYGPTEGTVWSTVARFTPDTSEVTIGSRITNVCVYVLDEHLNIVPIGVGGEIYIGGEGLARGYMNQPALTAQRFVPNPFSRQRGARLYRTGDLARYRSDGDLILLGRNDHQVKLRGYRIELNEIEAVMMQHPDVREVVVMCREDAPNDKRIVAYLVPAKESAPSTSDLRQYLQVELPAYMVPSVFVTLNELPFGPNGKVDRNALPAPEGARPELAILYAAPETQIEKRLAEIWGSVLNVERIGRDDNFFDLGGHSFLVVKVHERIRQDMQVEIPLIKLFEFPTIYGLSQFLENQQVDSINTDETQAWASRRRQALQRQRQALRN